MTDLCAICDKPIVPGERFFLVVAGEGKAKRRRRQHVACTHAQDRERQLYPRTGMPPHLLKPMKP